MSLYVNPNLVRRRTLTQVVVRFAGIHDADLRPRSVQCTEELHRRGPYTETTDGLMLTSDDLPCSDRIGL